MRLILSINLYSWRWTSCQKYIEYFKNLIFLFHPYNLILKARLTPPHTLVNMIHYKDCRYPKMWMPPSLPVILSFFICFFWSNMSSCWKDPNFLLTDKLLESVHSFIYLRIRITSDGRWKRDWVNQASCTDLHLRNNHIDFWPKKMMA